MIEFSAIYYNGKDSTRTPVHVRGLDGSLHIVGANVDVEVARADVRVDARVADIRRSLDLPDGSQLQTDDHDALAALFPSANRFQAWVQTLERRWPYALAALVVTVGLSYWSVIYGLPLGAKAAAGMVPINIEAQLGEQTLYAFDKSLCGPSKLDAGKQRDLGNIFGMLTAALGDGYGYRLEFRDCGRVGPNAFALPGGAVIVTDELVKLAQNDQQIAAVLAHEIGHVSNRHGLRLALQGAGAAALLATLAGDVVSVTSLAVALPTVLLQTGYTREFETEADTYAFRRLKEVGLSPKYFAEIMMRLEEYHAKRAATAGDSKPTGKSDALDYLSTHPDTARRIERALANQ